MILVLDNYDSFTYNLVQYIGEFTEDIEVVRNDAVSLEALRDKSPEKIVISPGPGRPENAGLSIAVVRELGPAVP
ncbi:MAG: aminodeoxychorismate/anthranilate synthase component II, partial [Calditrichaeota bacterium]|nr:aminodeoxychorismate/anthranilate synthase component II [Calditrichota bacterium]